MRDQLPPYPNLKEKAVVNLDSSKNAGTHWVCYDSSPEKILYFDSYGLPPPLELIQYLRKRHPKTPLEYSTFKLQGSRPICGHLCLLVLKKLSDSSSSNQRSDKDYISILLNLKKKYNLIQ